jgi:hypothetical protein
MPQPFHRSSKMSCRGVGVGNSSSHSVPLPILDDVIPIVKDDDIDSVADPINSPNHNVFVSYFFIVLICLSVNCCFLSYHASFVLIFLLCRHSLSLMMSLLA